MLEFTELKCDSVTNALLAFLKILRTLAGNICNGVSFQDSYGHCGLESSNYLKGTPLKTFILVFPETLRAAAFSENHRKFFLEACRFYIVTLLL